MAEDYVKQYHNCAMKKKKKEFIKGTPHVYPLIPFEAVFRAELL